MPGQEKKLPGKEFFLLLRIPVRVRAGFFLLQEKDACKGIATRWYFANMGLAV
jgi:hypothetical protein